MRKGDVWLINLDPTIGAEIKKTRPAVMIRQASRFVTAHPHGRNRNRIGPRSRHLNT